MGSNYIFSLTPTFTQGLVLGQLSILVLIALVLKYLFLVSPTKESQTQAFHPHTIHDHPPWRQAPKPEEGDSGDSGPESANWFNLLARQVIDVYRAKLQDGFEGLEGNEIARRRVEAYANSIRPRHFIDHITVHAVDLGSSAPHLSNARTADASDACDTLAHVKFDLSYIDSVSISLSTTYLFNYPMPSFARLPVSLTISLSAFQSTITLAAPSPTSVAPVLSITLPPNFTLKLKTTSLMGSRAMLRDVPKLHDLIEHQVRRVLATKGAWKVVLPGLTSVAEAKAEMEKSTVAAPCS
ncbi:hypothetical protein ID866_620 [Astraeus odoratus]|nr:hypothetical protein ID866_620 [Astraeus odoratus]